MPRPGCKGFLFSLPEAKHERFKGNCYFDGVKMSDLVERFIDMYNQKSEVARAKNRLNGNQ